MHAVLCWASLCEYLINAQRVSDKHVQPLVFHCIKNNFIQILRLQQ